MELINKIREQLGFPPFIKIDPNTQQAETGAGNHQKLGQAAICAVLVGIYKYSRSEEGFYYLLNKDRNLPWPVVLFGKEEHMVVRDIAAYAGEGEGDVRGLMDQAGKAAWHFAEELLENHFSYSGFSKLFNDMRNDILHYLPAQLQLGKVLNDNSLDDRTNKMEGPVSGMMHRIEKIFSLPQ